ncbi:MAG: type I secretion C-terminal target domain-containing protein, partial [Spartobacteria bacterium]|nr:type I secretion C-terminal target domain-containing protein [Spartobacteria bacterium]
TQTEPARDSFDYLVTDANGNTTTGTITVDIVDDVPSATIAQTDHRVYVDESLGSDDVLSALGISSNFLVYAQNVVYGADQDGLIDFRLVFSSGSDSGLMTTSGEHIYLFDTNNDGIVEGRVGDGSGALAFTVEIEKGTMSDISLNSYTAGNVILTQYASLNHPLQGIVPESITLNSNSLKAVMGVVDGDGDVFSEEIDISRELYFKDDTPHQGFEHGFFENTTGVLSGSISELIGSDKDGSSVLFSILSGLDIGCTFKGDKIYLYVSNDGHSLIGSTLSGSVYDDAAQDVDVPPVFSLIIDNAGSYTFSLFQELDVNFGTLDIAFDVGVTDGDGDFRNLADALQIHLSSQTHTLYLGTEGQDSLIGSDGNDIFVGGTGADTMTGGGGQDVFKYVDGDIGSVSDTITDFHVSSDVDTLDLSALLENYTAAQSAKFIKFTNISHSGSSASVDVTVDFNGAVKGARFVPLAEVHITDFAGSSDSDVIDAMLAHIKAEMP